MWRLLPVRMKKLANYLLPDIVDGALWSAAVHTAPVNWAGQDFGFAGKVACDRDQKGIKPGDAVVFGIWFLKHARPFGGFTPLAR